VLVDLAVTYIGATPLPAIGLTGGQAAAFQCAPPAR
jgi:hypothetical protein